MELKAEHLTRQIDLIPLKVLGEKITIIGAGAIGSFTALGLAKMGFGNLTVMDFDKVDTVNMNSQFYRFQDIGKPKVQALFDIIKDFANIQITAVNDAYTGATLNGIVISAVDSMATRKTLWENSKAAKMFIDARMGAEFAALYTMSPNKKQDIIGYENTLYTDEEAVETPCTQKATIYTVQLIAGQVCKIIKDIVLDSPYVRVAQWNIKENVLESYLGGISKSDNSTELPASTT